MNFQLRFDQLRDQIGQKLDQPIPGGSGTACIVGQVVTATSAIAVGKYLMVNPVSILGAEVEGGGAAISVNTSDLVPVYLVGPTPAQHGDLLICRFINHRWVADRGGHTSSFQSLPGCPCQAIPSTLFMHVQRQPTNGTNSVAFPATLVWGPKPADLGAWKADDPGYYSTAAYQSTNGFYKLRYQFGCSLGQYFIKGLTTTDSPLSVPQWSIVSWLVGLPGNTCVPFQMHSGAWHSPEGQPDQGVTVDGGGPA